MRELLGRPATGRARTSAPTDQARFFRASTGSCRRRSRALRPRAALVDRRATSAGASRAIRCAAGFDTFFKGGWRGTGAGQLVHEAALFERGAPRFSMAVLTDGNPSHDYGTATLRGVAQRIFRRGRRAAAGAPAHRGGRHARHAAGRPRGRPPLGPGHPRRAGLPRPQHNLTGAPLPGYCENWALLLERGRLRPRPGAALPAPPRPRPAGARRLPPGARLARARALGRAERPRRRWWAPTSPAAAATTPAAPWT